VDNLRKGSVLAVAGIAAVISFLHIYHLCITHLQGRVASALLPLAIDGAVIVATMSMLTASGIWKAWARVLLFLAVTLTLAANVAYGIPAGMWGAILSGWPAVAFLLCAELAIGMSRHASPVKKAASRKPEKMPAAMPGLHAVPDADEAARLAWLESGRTLSARKLAEAHGRSRMYWAPRIEKWQALA